ncbi:putative Mitochondrial inner membrane protease subunit 2 [Seiridium cardinale]|uniref:Mitochondrial inner membrane protease subunit n=1 Tax=Seiridium cardinale TaxID=138064 RepID=A0ABR2XKR7_9PEZI
MPSLCTLFRRVTDPSDLRSGFMISVIAGAAGVSPKLWIPAATAFAAGYTFRMNYTIREGRGPSMYPLFSDLRTSISLSRVRDPTKDLQRGMIVSFRRKIHGEQSRLCKRVIGLPGDVVYSRASHTRVWAKPYVHPHVKIPAGHYWVEGDNPDASADSNLFGPIPEASIVERVEYCLWPYSNMGRVRWEEFNATERHVTNRHIIARVNKDAEIREVKDKKAKEARALARVDTKVTKHQPAVLSALRTSGKLNEGSFTTGRAQQIATGQKAGTLKAAGTKGKKSHRPPHSTKH